MKKLIFCVICAAILLTGCKGEDTAVKVDGSNITLDNAGIVIAMPDGWEILSGDALYEQMASHSAITADELREAYDEAGMCHYARGASTDSKVMAVISSQNMAPEADGDERVTLADYARSVHDSTIFEYFASDYKTGGDSSFAEASYGDKNGYLSYFEVFTADEASEFIVGFSEYFFEQDQLIYSVQVCYFDEAYKDEAMSVIENIAAI